MMGAGTATASPRVAVRVGDHWGLLAAAAGVAVWLLADPRTPDLAGQVYRANLFGEAGWIVWDSRWYAGHAIPGYSLLFGPLGALLGVRTVGALAVLVSAALFERILGTVYGARVARWGAVWFALAALGDVWSGRVAFALGVSFALGAVWAAIGVLAAAFPQNAALSPEGSGGAGAGGAWRGGLACVLAALCAACSPVAGALLALAGVTHALLARSWRGVVLLALPALAVVAVMVGLFGEGGWEPYPLRSFVATAAVLVLFGLALPWRRGLLWVGLLLYGVACVACVALHTPMGANVERYGVLLAGPLLLCAVLSERAARRGVGGGEEARVAAERVGRGEGGGGVARMGAGAWAPATVALLGIAVWTAWGPARETLAVAGDPSTRAAYYAPVVRFVAAHGGSTVRVEVPFTRGHWEAAWLARRVSLARGWEKQLDERYDGVLLSRGLTAAEYRRWLQQQAVAYVALPDAPLDPSSAREGRLVESGLPYLRPVLRTAHWRIFAVRPARPIASGPGALVGMGHDWFQLRARRAGRFVVRVRYTRYFEVTRGAGRVGRTPGGWTAVTVRGAGAVRVAARFSLGRALGL